MKIQSTRFGEIEICNDNIILFPSGLPGFPEEKRFALLLDADNPFAFFQSITTPHLTFIIVEPFTFFKDYTFELSDEFVQDLRLSNENPPYIYNIVTIRSGIESATANLLAPIIINWQTKKAQQLILEKTNYTTRHKLFPDGLPKQSAQEGGK